MSTAVAGVLLLIASCPASAQTTQGLFSQAAKATLVRNFASPDISYLLMDASGNVLAERWPSKSPPLAVSPGSLVKPFLAIAYGEQYGGEFHTVHCMGARSRCWLPEGYGVGMCQCGAQGMAMQGKTASEILQYYYPGSKLVRAY